MTENRLNCPNNCGYLTEVNFAKTDIDVCRKCKGVWLDFGEVASILKNAKPNWSDEKEKKILRHYRGFNRPPLFEGRELECPHCEELLDEVNYQATSNIVVNPCSAGHGLWLDRGELLAIRVFLSYWGRYAQEHHDEIKSSLKKVEKAVSEWEAKVVRNTRSSIPVLNGMIHEVLKQLGR